MRYNEFRVQLNEGFDPDVLQMQKELKAAGAYLGTFGPKGDGLDGMLGPYTRRAAKQHPEIADKYKEVLAQPDVGSAQKIDTKLIQDPDFNKKLKKVADALGIDAEDLKIIIKNESGGDPKAQDPWGVSAGLIGFTSQTARALGTSKAEILQMDALEQLDLVYKFYKMVGVRPGEDRGTIYMRTFMPAFARAPDDTVLGQQGGGTLIGPSGKSTGLSMHKVWEQNPVFGKSKGKSFFTVGDVKKHINSRR